MARRSHYDPEKRRKLPEPRYRKSTDEFKELTGDDTAEKFLKSDTGEDAAVKGFGLRRSKRPFEAAKEQEEEEESSRQPEYGKTKRTRRRHTKRT